MKKVKFQGFFIWFLEKQERGVCVLTVLAIFPVIHNFEDWKNFSEKRLFLKVHDRFTTC